MEFCPTCRNMLYTTVQYNQDEDEMFKICKKCDTSTKITESVQLSETLYTDDDIKYKMYQNKYIRYNPTLRRIIDPNVKPPAGFKHKSTDPICYIKYNNKDQKFMYISETTGEIWRNT
jgi:DNA-directed RNA polymerase subunit M/transcription elongation factor TFIIS